jgi:hypothetical protein
LRAGSGEASELVGVAGAGPIHDRPSVSCLPGSKFELMPPQRRGWRDLVYDLECKVRRGRKILEVLGFVS